MPTLTIEDIRENPWNVLTHDLPERPSLLLLTVAHCAATCCRQIEAEVFDKTPGRGRKRDAWTAPYGRVVGPRFVSAHLKIVVVCRRLEDEYGVQAPDNFIPPTTS